MKRKTNRRWYNHVHHHLRLTLWPHKANHYRPHLIRRYGLLVVLGVVVASQGLYNLGSNGSVLGIATDITAEQLLAATNTQREKAGLKSLAIDEKLAQAASLKAQDMFENQYWAHESPDGVAPWHWMDEAGYMYDFAGENLAKNFHTADSTLTAWMASPAHQKNVLSAQYNEVGFAVVDGVLDGRSTNIVVAFYGHELEDQSVMPAAVTASAPINEPLAPVTRLGMAVQSLSPVALGSIVLLLLAVSVALAAQFYRRKLPKKLQRSWYRHHGLIKMSGLFSLCIVLLMLYGGGQI